VEKSNLLVGLVQSKIWMQKDTSGHAGSNGTNDKGQTSLAVIGSKMFRSIVAFICVNHIQSTQDHQDTGIGNIPMVLLSRTSQRVSILWMRETSEFLTGPPKVGQH
jgi:hypothetical protein